jgi:hypothetical protein
MFCGWQFCFRRASLSRFIHRFPSNQGQTHCFDFVCQLSPICNSPVDTPMIISSFILAVNTCHQHDKLFTRRQIQIVLILFQSHCRTRQRLSGQLFAMLQYWVTLRIAHSSSNLERMIPRKRQIRLSTLSKLTTGNQKCV